MKLNFKHDNELDLDGHNKFSRKQLVELQQQGYDLDWLKEIQPQGGIFFGETQAQSSDGYFQVMEITSYSSNPTLYWLANLMINPYTICTLDTKTDPKDHLLNNINQGLDELLDRQVNSSKQIDQHKAQQEYQAMLDYADSLTRGGEVAKQIRIRVFVYGQTQQELEERTTDIRNEIQNLDYKATIFLFEPRPQFDSLFMNMDEQKNMINARMPYSIRSTNLGGGIPFHHQSLKDPNGYPFGATMTGGTFIWDPFRKTKTRLSYNGGVFGTMGAGKSNLLKMIEEAMVGAHNMVRGIDIPGDFKQLVKEQNGIYVPLDGSGGILNPLEVLGTIINRTNGNFKVDEAQSFMQHISKVSDQFRFLNPEFSTDEIQELRMYLQQFYIAIGLVPKDYQHNIEFKITGLSNDKYPVLTDFYNYLMEVKMPEGVTPDRYRILERLQLTVKDIISNYGSIFDGHSTIKNLSDEQIVYFGAGDLQSQSPEVFRCQLYTALTLMWNHALQNGIKMKYLLDNQQISEKDIRYCIAFLDECHNIINTDMIFAVKYVTKFEREMRKFLAGVWLATQSPEEMVPEGANDADTSTIKTALQLTQYKFLMRTDSASIPAVHRLLGEAITDSEYEKLPNLEVGQSVCNFGSKETYTVKFMPDAEQLKRFAGGR